MPAGSSITPTSSITDVECLAAWRQEWKAQSLRPLVERYGAFVYSSAYRRTGSAERAEEVTRAVFLVLARRARKLRKKTVLAGWLFDITGVACRKGAKRRWWSRLWPWFRRRTEVPPEATLWERVAPELDAALDRLPARQRNPVLLRVLLNQDSASASRTLRISERRVAKSLERGLKKVTKHLRRRKISTGQETLAQLCSTEGWALPLPEGLVARILESIEARRGKKPSFKLARRVLRSLAWTRWRRRLAIGTVACVLSSAAVGGVLWQISARSGHSWVISELIIWFLRWEGSRTAEPARPWPTNAATPPLDATLVRNAPDLYQTTNVWLAHLKLTRKQWKALDAKRIAPLPNFRRPDGLIALRNPNAARSGLAGVLGYEFEWTHGDFEFGGMGFTNIAVRLKGNALSLYGLKRAFKVDLNAFAKSQKLGGLDELTFNCLGWDYSCIAEALAYEFFRDAGVPAPRTTYAWVSASVTGQWDRKPLGLYVMLEPVGEAFVKERFGSKKTPVFKPVTYDLFEDLGDNWSAYAGIYDLKTQATPEQQRRLIDLARLVSKATDAEFAARVGEFLDLDEFGRFLAAEVLLANYDSILTDGQNFYMYLEPRSMKFGFIPWDLDSSWGEFWIGTPGELERASIGHPWVGKNRFLERVLAVEAFRQIYRGHLEDFLARLFVPERLHRRIDQLAAVVREPVSAESAFRLNKFERAVGANPVVPLPGEKPNHLNHPPYVLKRFIEARAKSVRSQLDGKSRGMLLKTPAEQ